MSRQSLFSTKKIPLFLFKTKLIPDTLELKILPQNEELLILYQIQYIRALIKILI